MKRTIVRMHLYRRHSPKCRFFGTEDAFSKTNCRCPIYVDRGSRKDGARKSLGTRDWTRATARLEKLLDAEAAGTVVVTVTEACEAFLADCRRRNLTAPTIRSYAKTLEHLRTYCEAAEVALIDEVDQGILLQFQNAREVRPDDPEGKPRPLEPSTLRKELQTLRGFFRFLVDQGSVDLNTAKRLRPPKESRRPTLPFSQGDIDKLVDAAASLEDDNPHVRHINRNRAEAILLVMLYSGLRISDVATLQRQRVNLSDGRLRLRMAKTGEPVYVRLGSPAVEALAALPVEGPFFFWSGTSAPATAIGNMRRTVARICEASGVSGHPHRFRDTFAVRMLEKGVAIDQVSILLGHTSVRTTEKYYAPWVQSRQKLLDEATAALDFVDTGSPSTGKLRRVK